MVAVAASKRKTTVKKTPLVSGEWGTAEPGLDSFLGMFSTSVIDETNGFELPEFHRTVRSN